MSRRPALVVLVLAVGLGALVGFSGVIESTHPTTMVLAVVLVLMVPLLVSMRTMRVPEQMDLQMKLLKDTPGHMERLEAKLDRIIELMEERTASSEDP